MNKRQNNLYNRLLILFSYLERKVAGFCDQIGPNLFGQASPFIMNHLTLIMS